MEKYGLNHRQMNLDVTGTNTTFFIQKRSSPNDRRKDITYGSFGCELKPNKEEKHCT
jgi:hypothetical protein